MEKTDYAPPECTLPPIHSSTPIYTHYTRPARDKASGIWRWLSRRKVDVIFSTFIFPTMQYTLNEYPRSHWNTNNCSFLLHSLVISSLFQTSQIFLLWHFAKWEIIIWFKTVINTNHLYLKCNFVLHAASSAIPFSPPFYTNKDNPCCELLDNALGSASWLSP